MRYLALACDYDGTLASEGRVSAEARIALRRLRESGRRSILVTGRHLEDLREVFPELGLFDRVVAENGALLYSPESKEERLLCDAPPAALVEALRLRRVAPLAIGRAILATWEPSETLVLDAIRDLGLEYQVIFNKGAVMVLPSGVNKATGLTTALDDLHLSAHNTVTIGDAENDHALLSSCELAVAVANALPSLKERADFVTNGECSDGVVELIERLLADDLRELSGSLRRADLVLGQDPQGQDVRFHAWGRRLLLCGASGSGKSTLTTGFVEQLVAKRYQLCLVDPEGDYDTLPGVIVVGDAKHPPSVAEVTDLLATASNHVVANLLGLQLEHRPEFLATLLPRLLELRARFGRPHWIIVDEAHHMLPREPVVLPEPVQNLPINLLAITVHPERLAPNLLVQLDGLIAVGDDPGAAVRSFASATDRQPAPPPPETLGPGEAWVWSLVPERPTTTLFYLPPKSVRHRHDRKYASGKLGEDKSFFFRGPRGALNLRAQNLAIFLQLAEGVDDVTWLYHLTRHDYSRWIREAIKNDALADELQRVESTSSDPMETRQRVRAAIENVYTLPA